MSNDFSLFAYVAFQLEIFRMIYYINEYFENITRKYYILHITLLIVVNVSLTCHCRLLDLHLDQTSWVHFISFKLKLFIYFYVDKRLFTLRLSFISLASCHYYSFQFGHLNSIWKTAKVTLNFWKLGFSRFITSIGILNDERL